MRPKPDPRVIAHLCGEYPRATRADVEACWGNADQLWREIPPEVLADEPRELTAARALFVHGTLCNDPGERAEHFHGMWSLVMMHVPQQKRP